jgi:hypothetical protein
MNEAPKDGGGGYKTFLPRERVAKERNFGLTGSIPEMTKNG